MWRHVQFSMGQIPLLHPHRCHRHFHPLNAGKVSQVEYPNWLASLAQMGPESTSHSNSSIYSPLLQKTTKKTINVLQEIQKYPKIWSVFRLSLNTVLFSLLPKYLPTGDSLTGWATIVGTSVDEVAQTISVTVQPIDVPVPTTADW